MRGILGILKQMAYIVISICLMGLQVPAPKEQTKEAGYSDCAMKGLAYKPRKGDIIVFWSIRTDGEDEAGKASLLWASKFWP